MGNAKIMITGVGGMVGSHLTDYYSSKGGFDVLGTYFTPTTDIGEIEGTARLEECDIRDFGKLNGFIKEFRPDVIFHLAAQSFPTVSWEKPVETMEINVNGTIHLFEALKVVRDFDAFYDPVVVVACSSAEYGATMTPENVPISEEVALKPLHPYGVSKVAQENLAFQYFKNNGIRTVGARIFNTTGPRKVNDVCADFTKRAVLIERGEEEVLRVGNLDGRRAITDVRDLIEALVLLSEKAPGGEVYNISGENVYKIGDIIPIIEKYIKKDVAIEVDQSLLRSTDEAVIYGDSAKLKELTGWSQKFSLEETISDMIDYWRATSNN